MFLSWFAAMGAKIGPVIGLRRLDAAADRVQESSQGRRLEKFVQRHVQEYVRRGGRLP